MLGTLSLAPMITWPNYSMTIQHIFLKMIIPPVMMLRINKHQEQHSKIKSHQLILLNKKNRNQEDLHYDEQES